MNPGGPYRFASTPFANTIPLTHCLDRVSPGASVSYDRPSALLKPLLNREVDAAVLTVIDLFTAPELMMIADLGICTEREVRSVRLQCRVPLAEVKTIAFDPASRTANALATILLSRHWRLTVRRVEPDTGEPPDATVIIGDRALCAPPAPAGDYDLAGHWHRMTGLPFVFAVWASRRDHPDPQGLADILHAAKDAGIALLPELAREQAKELGLTEAQMLDYFTTCIHYELGERERQGLELFRQLAAEFNLAPPTSL